MAFQKAKREQIWLKVLLGGPSGSGKTYSALRLATGVAKKAGSRIAAIDTESGRIRYYADEFDFDDMQLSAPFTPESYIKAIEDAIDAGYKVLVIDSTTHEWKGKGGCIEIHDAIPGNSYTAWGKVKPRHQSFVDEIIQSPIHLICTARGKDEYTLEDKNGKQVPKKVGVGIEQQDDAEYNYTVTFNIDQSNHVAEVMKDNTHIFEGKYEVLTEKHGEALYNWANSGDAPVPKAKPTKTDVGTEESLTGVITNIQSVATTLAENGVDKTTIGDTIKSIFTDSKGKPSANYNAIKDINVAKNVLEALNKLGGQNE